MYIQYRPAPTQSPWRFDSLGRRRACGYSGSIYSSTATFVAGCILICNTAATGYMPKIYRNGRASRRHLRKVPKGLPPVCLFVCLFVCARPPEDYAGFRGGCWAGVAAFPPLPFTNGAQRNSYSNHSHRRRRRRRPRGSVGRESHCVACAISARFSVSQSRSASHRAFSATACACST